jgi:hypothetical protein
LATIENLNFVKKVNTMTRIIEFHDLQQVFTLISVAETRLEVLHPETAQFLKEAKRLLRESGREIHTFSASASRTRLNPKADNVIKFFYHFKSTLRPNYSISKAAILSRQKP